ncbi:2'-5' RNA ligase [Alkalibacterium subtropicum]|uniref:RNA 2',3'-cyclic phosphodiesterase n=1 Tax=Alkalibacterium subtropicum TaxID=753702 RepID=A0A1I1HFG7_9LACT|nr:RNA 2',3'-cyclic phosphodiesterase [Alkalibacterium subtropicum]SFC22747.1 2'-5' RNA ligase [Alkalibacterium subtropicum]
MRVFIAVELEDKVKDMLIHVQDRLRPYVSTGNYTDRNNFHITLRFIGNVDQQELNVLKQVIDTTALHAKALILSTDKLGHFPRKNKEIIWVGVKGQVGKLFKLKKQLEIELEEAGFSKEEQDYTPHITMVRQAVSEKGFDEIKADLRVPKEEIAVRSIALMESKRVDGELVYTAIHKQDFH